MGDMNALKSANNKSDIYAKKEDVSKLTQDINALKSANTSDAYAKKEELSKIEKQVINIENGMKEVKDNVKADKEIVQKMEADIKSCNRVSSDLKSSVSSEVKQMISSEITKFNDKISNQQGNNKVTDQVETALKKIEDSVKAEKEKLQTVENKVNCLEVKSFVKQSDMSGFVKKEEMKNELKTNLDSDIKQLKTFINEEISNLKKSGSNEGSKDISNLKSNFISKEEFT